MPSFSLVGGGKKRMQIVVVIVFIVVLAVASLLLFHKQTVKKTAAHTAEMSKYCIGQDFTAGATGHCVSDIQTLANYMEHSGLNECPFVSGAQLAISGSYSQATTDQIKSIQNWSDCYAAQEGFRSNVVQSGTVDRPTWGELCTFGYTDPLQSKAAGAADSIAAGTDAGCSNLHK